jgi:hypothetical protein
MITSTVSAAVRPPRWYWVASWLALLWMLSGAAAFVMDALTDEAALAQMTAAQRELYEARPQWLFAVYGLAIVSGLAGTVGLLLRKAWAGRALAVSLAAVVIQFGYTVFGLRAIERVGASQALSLPVVVFLAGTVVLIVALKAKKSGWIAG